VFFVVNIPKKAYNLKSMMRKTVCLHCLNEVHSKGICEHCHSDNVALLENNSVEWNHTKVHKQIWLARLSTFSYFSSEQMILKYPTGEVHPRYLKQMFLENVKIHRFFRLILPAIWFFVVSLLFFMMSLLIAQEKIIILGNKTNVVITSLFMGGLMLAFALSFFVFVGLGRVVYITLFRNKKRYVNISKQKYLHMIDCYNMYGENYEALENNQ
jgi:hypothetical protein